MPLSYISLLFFIFYFFFLINIFVFVNGKLYLIFGGENTLICRDEEIIGVFSRLSEPFCLLVNMKLYVWLKCLFMSCF